MMRQVLAQRAEYAQRPFGVADPQISSAEAAAASEANAMSAEPRTRAPSMAQPPRASSLSRAAATNRQATTTTFSAALQRSTLAALPAISIGLPLSIGLLSVRTFWIRLDAGLASTASVKMRRGTSHNVCSVAGSCLGPHTARRAEVLDIFSSKKPRDRKYFVITLDFTRAVLYVHQIHIVPRPP